MGRKNSFVAVKPSYNGQALRSQTTVPAQPLGKITHYTYRIEFQQRGSPHAHCVILVENAPKVSDPNEDNTEFIDTYITCNIRSEKDEPDLHKLVTTVQRHHHTATCKKKSTNCRFNYAKLPSPHTLIATPLESDDLAFKAATIDTVSSIFTNIYDTLEDNKISSLDELLQKTEISLEQYVYAL
ncbi:hypothetical protein MAR_017191 [Mya arenaria]|uniref:Helitron helicase-like domain-containing protein n=1 Tax=Mya arenaria TaxID=6604 RepID=A0ABY7EB22_MYAAR|nr:hypothetical protein MAR_017191 [Mya arenaria]